MGWFRSHLRLGSRFALFAFAIQLVLSFGHVHLDGFAPSASSAVARLAAAVDGHPLVASPIGSTAPAKHKQNGSSDDFCAICSLLNMANTLVPSASAILPPPTVVSTIRLDLLAERALSASRPALFRARAPPLA